MVMPSVLLSELNGAASSWSAKSISPLRSAWISRVGVVEDPEDDLVDLGRPAPPGLVGREAHELAGLALLELERARANRVLLVVEGRDLLLVDVLPDVLGQDRHGQPQHARPARS
jgi:hypothetical protein